MNRGRLRLAGFAVAAVLLSSPGLTSCATQIGEPAARPSPAASPDHTSTDGPAVQRDLAVEEKLDQVADDIEQDRDGEDIAGYAGLEFDTETATVDVYWVGEPPEYVRRVAANAPAGDAVNLRPATYDLKAMLAAVELVFDKYGDYLHAASPNTEGSGITIEQTKDNAKRGPTPDEMTAVAGMPVTIEIGKPAELAHG